MHTKFSCKWVKRAGSRLLRFCINIEIEFIGIWCISPLAIVDDSLISSAILRDSVGSVGLNSTGLPLSNASTTIKTFCHALSLDEHQALFNVNTWHCYENVLAEDPGISVASEDLEAMTRSNCHTLKWEHMYSSNHKFWTDILEVWFAGCHSGGSLFHSHQFLS